MKIKAKDLQRGDYLAPVVHYSTKTIRRLLYQIESVHVDKTLGCDAVQVFVENIVTPFYFAQEDDVDIERELKQGR